jgi:hypothetical protein
MTNLDDLTVNQLQRIITIRQQIEDLQTQLDSIGDETGPGLAGPKAKRRMSAAGRKAIAAGVRRRWAKIKGSASAKADKPVKRGRMSADGRAKMAAVARLRWKKAKMGGRMTL